MIKYIMKDSDPSNIFIFTTLTTDISLWKFIHFFIDVLSTNQSYMNALSTKLLANIMGIDFFPGVSAGAESRLVCGVLNDE